jgi:hypothetical protein
MSQQTMSREGEVISLNNYTVSKPKQGIKVDLSIKLQLPGLPEHCPRYIWENAARNIWIAVQGKMRNLTEATIRAFDGQTIDGSDLSKTFESKRQNVDRVTKATNLLANMTEEEKAQFYAMLQDTNN